MGPWQFTPVHKYCQGSGFQQVVVAGQIALRESGSAAVFVPLKQLQAFVVAADIIRQPDVSPVTV